MNTTSKCYFTETQDWNIYQSCPTLFSIFLDITCLLPINIVKISITFYQFEKRSYVEEILFVLTKSIPCSHLAKWPLPCFFFILFMAKTKETSQLITWCPHTLNIGEGNKVTSFFFFFFFLWKNSGRTLSSKLWNNFLLRAHFIFNSKWDTHNYAEKSSFYLVEL